MKIVLAPDTGFCFGVKNAVAAAEKALAVHGVLSCNGDIVHNPVVMDELIRKGLRIVPEGSVPDDGPFIIRSHGLPPSVVRRIAAKGIRILDATCPYVKKLQQLIARLDRDGYAVFIIGDENHPEVRALTGFGKRITVLGPGDDVRFPPGGGRTAVVAQTTLPFDEYERSLRKILDNRGVHEVKMYNTICRVTGRRQEAARRLSGSVDAVLVLGGRRSANTQKLYQVCKSVNPRTVQIESAGELERLSLRNAHTIGITSGTSTSEAFIGRVVRYLKKSGKEAVHGREG